MLLPTLLVCWLPIAVGATTCPYPPPEVPESQYPYPWKRSGNFELTNDGTSDILDCSGTYYIAQEGAGSKPYTNGQSFYCNATNGKWTYSNGYEAPPIFNCVSPATAFDYCSISNQRSNGATGSVNLYRDNEQYCPVGFVVQYADGTGIRNIKCIDSELEIEDEFGTISKPSHPTLTCVQGFCTTVCSGTTTTSTTTTTTTTTVATTTTVPQDIHPTASQLWNVMFYYNYGLILHAFCADAACLSVVQSNGIGYDTVNYKGVVGRAIKESEIADVRAKCPTGSQHLRNLGFTKVGRHYEHNLSGSGLKQGWVAIVNGACGMNKPIKRWKCHYSEDLMYDDNLEGNTYYKGLVQDGGKVHFYMFWELS